MTAEISGGNKRARFYSNVGYYRQNDIFNFGEADKNFTSRLNIRGNVDVTINEDITAYANANATFYDIRSGRTTYETEEGETYDYWTEAASMRPNRFAPLIPLSYIDPNAFSVHDLMGVNSNIFDGMFLAGSQIDNRNIFADYYAAGYNKYTSRQFQFDTGIDFDLHKLLKGLSFHFQFAVDYATSYNTSFNNTYRIYTPTCRATTAQMSLPVPATKEPMKKRVCRTSAAVPITRPLPCLLILTTTLPSTRRIICLPCCW